MRFLSNFRILSLKDRLLYLLLIGLIIFVLALRFWQLDVTPAGFFVDESSIAYNGYTLLYSGMDEHGSAFPVYFKAFGEYKNPLFIYLQVPFFVLFGVSRLTARLVSAFLLVSAALVYVLLIADSLRTYSNVRKQRLHQFLLDYRVLIAGLIFLVLPWTFHLGRVVFEIAVFPVVFLVALWSIRQIAWASSTKMRARYWMIFSGLLGLLFYSYTVARFVSPVMLFIASGLYLQYLNWKHIGKGWILFLIVLSPAVWWQMQYPDTLLTRFSMVAVQSPESTPLFSTLSNWVSAYFSQFSPYFLFEYGDGNLRHGFLASGPFTWVSAVFLVLGVIQLIQNEKRIFVLFLLAAVLISPIPGMLTVPNPHVLRSITNIVIFTYCIGLGVLKVWQNKEYTFAIVFAFSIEALVLISGYFTHFSLASRGWYEADAIEAFEQTMPQAPTPYVFSQNMYPGTSTGARFIFAQNGGAVFEDRQNVTGADFIDTVITEQKLLDLKKGTVYMTRAECVLYASLLQGYYSEVWASEHSCVWRRDL